MAKILQVFALASFVVMGFAVASADAGGVAHTGHYSKGAKVVCGKTGCRARGQ
jgi:hypothetical protein